MWSTEICDGAPQFYLKNAIFARSIIPNSPRGRKSSSKSGIRTNKPKTNKVVKGQMNMAGLTFFILLLSTLVNLGVIVASPPVCASRRHAASLAFLGVKSPRAPLSDLTILNGNADTPTDAAQVDPSDPFVPRGKDFLAFEKCMGAWVPIGSRGALTGLGPTRVKVMGLDLVVWENGDAGSSYIRRGRKINRNKKESNQSQWSVLRDVCSHKFAALSQGRVNPDTSCIECPYHGWQFDNHGILTCIPQSEPSTTASNNGDDQKENSARKPYSRLPPALVKKASIQSFPVHITGDLIWAFLPTSIHGESFPLELLPENYYYNGLMRDAESGVNFAVVELPASYDFLMEK